MSTVSSETNTQDADRVRIFDTTLRDGEQSPGCSMNLEEKLQVAGVLEEMGVDIIEAGFPIASNGDFAAVQAVARMVKNSAVAGLARASRKDIDRAAEALKGAVRPRIHTFIATSPLHMKYKLQMEPDAVHQAVADSVSHARDLCDDVEWSCEDGTRSEHDFLCRCVETAIKAGARTINIPDTVGYAIPEEFAALITYLREQVPELGDTVRLSVHCHDDLGMSVANSLAAVKAGARQVEGCINGLGERAGNAALEEVIMALRTRPDYFGVDTQIDTKQLYATSRLISQVSGFVVQPNKAVIGRNAFRHASGIHQDGLLKERTNFEIMNPLDVGVPRSELVLGKLSGRHGLNARLEELGYSPTDEELGGIYESFKELADKKREVTDRDLIALMGHERMSIAETYTLDAVQVTCGSNAVATATVQLTDKDGAHHTDAATGTGPVDAIYQAINRIVSVPNELTEFSVNSVTEGIDAIGEVSIRIEQDGREYIGRGADTDIIVASARAYMNALNRLLAMGDVTRAPEAAGAV
ncbi:MAG: 2-isopropylmalate synthase [Proteobacteria bacterium]|nr:2-isopropylmalate synthase [Pseudomonadota bacterium]